MRDDLDLVDAGRLDERGAQPGDILGLAHEQLMIQCGQGRIALMKLQLAGRRIVTAREFASGRALTGSRLG